MDNREPGRRELKARYLAQRPPNVGVHGVPVITPLVPCGKRQTSQWYYIAGALPYESTHRNLRFALIHSARFLVLRLTKPTVNEFWSDPTEKMQSPTGKTNYLTKHGVAKYKR